MRKPSHLLIEEEANMLRYQRTIGKTLDAKMKFVQDSMAIAKAKIDQTIRAQYALLPPKFLLVLEGGKANSRRLIANAMLTFCRVKKLNYLALAFGTWKICLVQKESLARRPYYARNAAAFMMATWIVEVRTKKLKNWLLRWRYGVSIMIYTERYTSSVKIQSICRRWRDRQKFLSLHRQGNYNGILSDIYLAPERKKIKYKIPSEIRSTRRMYWKAAIFIQTMYRCWIECREYFYKRRQIVLLQSVGRMYSKYIWYRKLRATTIKCQAWARRTVKSIQYKRLKRATIIVQKYVRRYLSQLLVWRIFDRTVWRVDEARLAAAIMIQCRWRILKAKRKIKKMKFRQALREYSALVIQRNYYRSKKAFHTFFLMCCYRIRGEEDDKLDELATRMGRYKCARVIQRYYKLRYFQRIISSAIRIQCWFRGRLGYTLVRLMRKEKWAKRKLHHWARGRLRRRHRLIRQIQRWWWRLRKGRLLRHLWYKALMRDIEEDRIMAGKYFHGALRMQALIKGIWTRRWTTKYRAAMKIQRCMRAYLSRKHLRTWRRERMLKIVRKYVNNMIDERVRFRTAYLVRKHSEMIAKPQAMIRGYQVREKMQRAKDYAYRVGLAVVLIQRSWRKAGAVGRAVEELMSLRRMSANPFKKCETIHQLLYLMRKQTKQLYCTFDPRIGMKVSTLMYRLGLLELLEMFPKKEYVLVTDMQKLTMEKLEELYIRWRERIEQVKQTTNKNKNDQKDKKDQKKQKPRNIPTQSFQLILDVVTVPLFLRKRKYLGKVQMVQSLPDYTSPDRLELVIKSIFAKKFGKHLNTRANNLARDVIDMLWLKYNNFKAFGNVALTKGQLLRAIAITSEASHVLQFLQEIRSRSVAMTAEERNHDIDRLRKCSEQLQLAFDQARALLPEGIILDMFDKALTNVQFCRRRVAFIQTKLESDELKQLQLAKKNKNTSATNSSAAAATTTTTTTNAAHNPSANKKVVDNNSAELNAMPMWMSIELYRTPITVSQSLELSFHGTREDLQLELHASLCKIFADVLDKLWIASNGVQSIKNCWSNGALRRAMAVEKNKQFLEQAKNDYIADRQEDKVKIVWEKFRRQDTIARKVSNILNAIMERKANIEAWLQHICRFGWMELTDDYGYPYWLDNSPKANLSTYDMPTYTYKEWISVDKIQGVARKYIERQLEKRRIREEIKRREMEIAEEEHRKRLEEGLKAVKVTLSLKDRLIRKHVKRGKIETAFISTVPTVESMLPDRYQLDTHAVIRTGIWALLKSIINKDKDKSEPLEYKSYSSNWKYEIVVLYKVRHDQKQCEIRTVKGNRLSNIHFNRIVHMPYVVGTKVETRYKGLRLFYRSTIVKVHETIDREILYDVRYEDGEYEEKLARDVIRPSYTTLQEFLEGRKSIASGCISRHRRLLHVAKLKKDRVYNSSVALDKPNEVSIAAGETDGIPEEKSVDFTLLSIADDHTTTSSQLVELPTRLDAQIKIAYSRAAVRDDWELIVDPIARTATFEHKETKEIIDTLPSYSGVENVMAQRIQLRWLGFKAKKRLKRKIVSLSMKQLIYESIKKASKIAYVGYQFEGVTPMQMLRRCGHWELADAIELFYKIEKKDIRRVTYETLMNMSKESFESIGIVQVAHVRSLRELQLWWKKIKIKQRNIKLSFFNYYSNDYLDKRSMRDCIRDSEDQLFKKFLQIIPTSQSRTKQVCKMVATESHYPHTHLQIENYFKKFGDKPELARVSCL